MPLVWVPQERCKPGTMDVFQQKHTRQNKVINMAALPPCRQALKLHAG